MPKEEDVDQQTMVEAFEELRAACIEFRNAILETLPGFKTSAKALEALRQKVKDRWDSERQS